MAQSTPRGFLAALFDLSFARFITPTIISIVYAIALVLIGIWSIVFLISGFTPSYSYFGSSGPSAGGVLWHVVGAAVIFIVGALATRIQLELVMAVFRIAENTTPRE